MAGPVSGRGAGSAAVIAALTVFWGAGCDGARQTRQAEGRLEASTPRLAFGATTLGVEVRRGLELTQRGVLPVEVVQVDLVPDEGVFHLEETPKRVERDRLAAFGVTYRPLAEGHHRAMMTLTLRDGPPVRVALDGRGVDARAVPEGPVDFGRPALGTARRRTLVLRNDRDTAVPAKLKFTGVDEAEFAATAEVWLPPYSATEAALTYRPEGRAGPRQVALEVVPCPTCAPVQVEVKADAVEKPLVLSPDPLVFGSVQVDSERQKTMTLTNMTDEVIRVHTIALGTATDAGFRLETPPQPLVLLPLDSVALALSFTPMHLGAAEGTVEVQSDAEPEGSVLATIAASGGGSQLVVTPDHLDFKPTPAMGRNVLPVTIANGGADPNSPPLHVTGVTVEGDAFVLDQGVAPGTALKANERTEVKVAFAPTAPGTFQGALRVTSDDPLAPEVVVPLRGTAIDAVDCRLQVQPPALDFGGVRATKGAVLGSRITNVGTEPCSLWDAKITGDAAFSLQKPRPYVRLDPGDAVFLGVVYRPAAEGHYAANVTVQTSQIVNPEVVIPVTGGSENACLRPEPPFLAFGPRRVDCGPAQLTGTFRNACGHPVDVSSLVLGEGSDPNAFSLVTTSDVPATLAPNETVSATVRFTPGTPGYTASPLFAQGNDVPTPLLLTISGETLAEANHVEEYVQPTPAKVDMLWVIDNTASMDDERAALARSVGNFLNYADSRGIDYHIGVTTTGVGAPPPGASSETCSGGANGAENGRLFPVDGSRPRVVTNQTGNRAQILAANVDPGGCHSIEQGFEAARLALSPPLVDNPDDVRTPEPMDGNEGLLRDDAALAIVVVSDEDDSSPGSVSDAVRNLRGLKPTTPTTFSAIVAPAGGCPSAVEPGTKYIEAANALGGAVASVCDADWSGTLTTLADRLFQPRSTYVLAAAADPATLAVTLDGQTATGWRYDAASHAVVFDSLPAPGTRIRITYEEPCPAP